MKINAIKLSIIIPCYNELDKLPFNINSLINFLNLKNITNYELIIVNDGSSDYEDTIYYEKIKGIMSDIIYVSYNQNRGKGGAVKEGILNASGDWVLFMDADLSTSLDSILDVLNNINNFDVIIGSRKVSNSNIVNNQSILRRITGKCCSLITNFILPLNIKDTQCGFKAFEGTLAKKIISKQTLNNFSFDIEYLFISKLNNKKILELGVTWCNDDDSRVPVLKTSINFFRDLIKVRLNRKYYKLEDMEKKNEK